MKPALIRAAIAASCLAFASQLMAAEPKRPECIAPAAPGGGFDLTCKLAQSALVDSKLLSSPMRVTYMPGGVGAVAYNAVVAQRPSEAGTITEAGKADWIGFTDIYWMSALIPVNAKAESTFRSLGNQIFRADVVYDQEIVQPRTRKSVTTKIFAGAKEHTVLDAYEKLAMPCFS